MVTISKQLNSGLIPGYRHIRDDQLIVRLEGQGNYTNLYLSKEQRPLLISSTLKWFERQLPSFMRISKSALVNPAYIEKVIKTGPKTIYIQLLDGRQLLVSRRRLTETISRLEQCFGRQHEWRKEQQDYPVNKTFSLD